MIEIVNAEKSDINAIQEIAQKTWPATFGDILSPDQIEYMLELMYSTDSLNKQMREDGHRFLLAKENSNNLGYASFEINYKNLNKTKIHKIYVLPTTQGKGLGKRILDSISEIARNNANEKLSLNVNRDNKAVSYYEHIGFSVVGQEDISIGNGFLMEDYVMEKNI